MNAALLTALEQGVCSRHGAHRDPFVDQHPPLLQLRPTTGPAQDQRSRAVVVSHRGWPLHGLHRRAHSSGTNPRLRFGLTPGRGRPRRATERQPTRCPSCFFHAERRSSRALTRCTSGCVRSTSGRLSPRGRHRSASDEFKRSSNELERTDPELSGKKHRAARRQPSTRPLKSTGLGHTFQAGARFMSLSCNLLHASLRQPNGPA